MLVLAFWLAAAALADDVAAPDAAAEASGLPSTEERAAFTPEQWIDAVDRRAASLAGMRFSVQRDTTLAGGQTVQERWRIVQYGSFFRIDYFGDTARQITFNGVDLVDYVPANRKALVMHVSKMSAEDARDLLGKVLQKVTVPGFRLGQAQNVAWTFGEATEVDGRPTVVLEGAGAQETHLKYVLDRERIAVLSTEIVQNGQTIRIESRDLREVHPGVWLPHEVRLALPDQSGEVHVIMHLTKVAVLADSPVDLFEAKLDPSIPVEERP